MTLDYVLTVMITMLTIVDPLGLIPVFLPIAARFSRAQQLRLIVLSVLVAVAVALVFLLLGKSMFAYLGISFEALFIVGGILLFLIGLDMIYSRPRKDNSSAEGSQDSSDLKSLAVFPLAIPMLSGPGTLAAIMMFVSRHDTWQNHLLVFMSLILSFVVAAIAMLFSQKLLKLFGAMGLNVIDRVVGIILCAIAVQFVINAIKALF